MSTLYVTDLDGTLLRPDASLSADTLRILNGLLDRGLRFTYATARSLTTASAVTAGLRLTLPVITKNGTLLMDPVSGGSVVRRIFSPGQAEEILASLRGFGLVPLVFTLTDDEERYFYDASHITVGVRHFLDSHPGDRRARVWAGPERLPEGDVHYFVTIGTEAELREAAESLGRRFRCVLSKDTYSEDFWLEVMPDLATKADGALYLKQALGCDRLVAFGDGVNDIPMLQAADDGHAMANAHELLKAVATDVIGSNEADGVARWLETHADLT